MVNYFYLREFVSLYVDFYFNGGVSKQFEMFKQGFLDVMEEGSLFKLFRPEELKELVCGSSILDFNDLHFGASYDGYEQESQIILYICNNFKENFGKL